MVVAIFAIAALIGLTAFGYYKIKNLNKQISDQQAQINDLNNKKKTLEDAASAAASSAANSVVNNVLSNNQYFSVPELGIKLKTTSTLSGLTYYMKGNAALFTTGKLMGSASTTPDEKGLYTYTCSPGAIGGISQNGSGTKVGTKYFQFQGPQSPCSPNAATKDLQNSQANALQQALNDAVPL